MQVPPLDGLDLLPELAARASPGRFQLACDFVLRELRPKLRVHPAAHLFSAGHRRPVPLLERLRMGDHVVAGDDGVHRRDPVGHLAGLADLPREQLRVHGAAVDVPERDPAPRQEPVQLHDPAHEVRVRLLPERFSTLAEELVDERRDAVGQRVGIEQRIVERVPLPGAVEPDFEVVVPAAGVLEDAADLVAEIPLDLEHQRARPAARIVGPPGEQLLGEGVHAGGGLAGADGTHDEDAGVEPLLGDDEPGGPLALARHGRMMQFADDERGRLVAGRGGPGGQLPASAAPGTRLEPDPRDREADAAGEQQRDGGRRVVPDVDRRV